MKRIIYSFAVLLALSYTALASTNSSTSTTATTYNYMRGYGNSFIFMEAGIEFSVFADGQFDFYIPQYGPNVNVGYNSPEFSISFNSGYNYNPYVQYDEYGAIIQIENTPVFYDYFGRVNQVGHIFINYNGFGRINRIGGLNVYYRNNAFWRCDGYINSYNRRYVYRPWHRFYAVPPVNLCVVNRNPYRQFYTPVRHIWYRPYRNNIRYYNVNGRRNTRYGRRSNGITNRHYAQIPRNNRERTIRRQATRRNTTIANARAFRVRSISNTPNRRPVTTIRTRTSNSNDRHVRTIRTTSPNRTRQLNETTRRINNRSQETRNTSSVSNRTVRQPNSNVRKPRATNSRTNARSLPQNTRRNTSVQSKRKPSNVSTRSNTSRSQNTRSNSRRSRS